MNRPATSRDLKDFDAAARLSFGFTKWCRVIEIGGQILLLYGSDGEHFCIFPTKHICEHRIAFARATWRAFKPLAGSGLKVRWPEHESIVAKWITWLGVRRDGDWAVL